MKFKDKKIQISCDGGAATGKSTGAKMIAKKYKLKFELLSDEKKVVLKKYGVWGKKAFMGKKYMGIIRTTILINAKGKIYKIWNNVRVKDHAKEVLDTIKNI